MMEADQELSKGHMSLRRGDIPLAEGVLVITRPVALGPYRVPS